MKYLPPLDSDDDDDIQFLNYMNRFNHWNPTIRKINVLLDSIVKKNINIIFTTPTILQLDNRSRMSISLERFYSFNQEGKQG